MVDIEKRFRNKRLQEMLDLKLKELTNSFNEILTNILDPNYEISYEDYGVLQYFIKKIRLCKKDILNNEEKIENGK